MHLRCAADFRECSDLFTAVAHLHIVRMMFPADKREVFSRRSIGIGCLSVLVGVGQLNSADSAREIRVGATRGDVIEVLGKPTGQSKLGNVELLHYRDGLVRLENGRVKRINLRRTSPPVETTTPVSAPPTTAAKSSATATDAKVPLSNVWITSLDVAMEDATRRSSVILALFTSSDATPSSRQFQKEITYHPEFVNAFRTHYVLLHVDFPVRAEQPSEMKSRNEALRDRLGVRALPALLILSATGEKIAAVEIADSVPGSAFRARFIATVSAAHELPIPVVPQVTAPTPPKPAPPVEAAAAFPVPPAEVTLGLSTARWLVSAALVVGTLIAAALMLVLWVVLRRINKPAMMSRGASMAWRIDHAASGLPSHGEISAWTKQTMCNLMVRLAETEGFVAEEQPIGSDKDLVLKRPGNPAPEVIVCCVTGNAGVIPTRRMREMVGMLAADDVPAGWFIAPMGFSLDARAYAEQNNIRLIDSLVLLEQLGNLPSFALPKVLAAVR